MRKNKFVKKRVEKFKSVYKTYEVEGLNVNTLINHCSKSGVKLFNIRKISAQKTTMAVNLQDSEKFFAISKELCYNIRTLNEKGILYPLVFLLRNVGVILGAVVFLFFAFYFNDTVLEINYLGSGSVYKTEVEEYLCSQNVKVYSKFSAIDLNALQDGILRSNGGLQFVSCKKDGNRLQINLVLAENKVNVLQGDVKRLTSKVYGVVEDIRVYRGTACVEVGESVGVGDLLVDGVMTVKDTTVETNVLCYVKVRTDFYFEYQSSKDGQEDTAILLASQELNEQDYKTESIEKFFDNGVYTYKVKLSYLCVHYAG